MIKPYLVSLFFEDKCRVPGDAGMMRSCGAVNSRSLAVSRKRGKILEHLQLSKKLDS